MLVVAVPEGLPLAVTLSLAYSVKVTPIHHNFWESKHMSKYHSRDRFDLLQWKNSSMSFKVFSMHVKWGSDAFLLLHHPVPANIDPNPLLKRAIHKYSQIFTTIYPTPPEESNSQLFIQPPSQESNSKKITNIDPTPRQESNSQIQKSSCGLASSCKVTKVSSSNRILNIKIHPPQFP